MDGSMYPLPAEEHDTHKAGLQEKGGHNFEGQERRKDVAHVLGKSGKIGAEFEFQDNAGNHSYSEIDGKDLYPKAIQAVIDLLLRDEPEKLHDH
jgi:hypothetical protein